MKDKNIQRIVKFMEASPLNAAFVATAMQKYVSVVTEDRKRTIELLDLTVINGEAWLRSADEWAVLSK